MTRKQKKLLLRILLAAALMVVLHFLPLKGLWRLGLYLIPYLIVGYDVLKKAAYGIWNRQVFDENFLMAVATVGALVLAVTDTGDYTEAVAVMLLYQLGELFQSYAVGKSRRSISALMDIRPDYANVEQDGHLERLDPAEIPVGSEIVVQPGEKVPIDGVVVEGTSALDTAALTGESLPREVSPGSDVLSGCVNLTGLLKLRTTREFGQSTASKILELVENASSRKSRSEAFLSKFSRYYTPCVCIGAVLLALLPPLGRLLAGLSPLWSEWIYRALSMLVISCPCALVISVPLSFFAGLGGASRQGILIKGSNYLEALSRADAVVFDKTGTLTQGRFEVRKIVPVGISQERLLELAAHAELASSHPIAASVRRAYGHEPERSRVTFLQEWSGRGVVAQVDGQNVAVGNLRLMQELSVDAPADCEAGTSLLVALDGVFVGSITVGDCPKDGAKDAVSALKRMGIRRTVMLTGDGETAARQVSEALGLDEYRAGLLPADKVTQVEALLSGGGRCVCFVGDGLNDAPVLSRADVGIAMGALGSDAAIEAADVVLMDDDPRKVGKAIRIARKCMKIVYENIVFALGVKLACLVLAALGLGDLSLAVFADVGVMVLAVLNAMRALFVKNV